MAFSVEKVHRLEKSTPPPVVRLWTNMRYACSSCSSSTGTYKLEGLYNYFRCSNCKKKQSLLQNTVLSNSNTTLHDFVLLMYHFCNNHCISKYSQYQPWWPVAMVVSLNWACAYFQINQNCPKKVKVFSFYCMNLKNMIYSHHMMNFHNCFNSYLMMETHNIYLMMETHNI